MNLGFRVLPIENRVDKELIEKFRHVVTPHISDNMGRMSAAGAELRPFHKEGKLVGPALTVKTRPGDNLLVHKAIDIAEPGDVIVVDAGGDMTNAIVGEIMKKIAERNGVAGFVINGAIRDVAAFKNDRFPVYAKGITHRGPYKDGPGEVNVPISIGGMLICPGDLIVGDEDGLVVIPRKQAEKILQSANNMALKELEMFDAIQQGTLDRTWVDKLLSDKGCEINESSKKYKTAGISQ